MSFPRESVIRARTFNDWLKGPAPDLAKRMTSLPLVCPGASLTGVA